VVTLLFSYLVFSKMSVPYSSGPKRLSPLLGLLLSMTFNVP
jgi:hypothetical protein